MNIIDAQQFVKAFKKALDALPTDKDKKLVAEAVRDWINDEYAPTPLQQFESALSVIPTTERKFRHVPRVEIERQNQFILDTLNTRGQTTVGEMMKLLMTECDFSNSKFPKSAAQGRVYRMVEEGKVEWIRSTDKPESKYPRTTDLLAPVKSQMVIRPGEGVIS